MHRNEKECDFRRKDNSCIVQLCPVLQILFLPVKSDQHGFWDPFDTSFRSHRMVQMVLSVLLLLLCRLS